MGTGNDRQANQVLSDLTVFMKYARFLPELGRRETWAELVDRNKLMHLKRFPELRAEIEEHYQLVYERKVLPSMRSLQFGGRAIELNNARNFNCSYMPMDDHRAFSELMFLLLSGCGVGYSVQQRHVEKLPAVLGPNPRRSRRFLIGDSIEGWSDAVKALVKAFFFGTSNPVFDFGDIRPEGAPLKTSGGRAPGPEPLKRCLHEVRLILERVPTGQRLTPLQVHDICCHIADTVLAGGVRRSAMIALFDVRDEEMLACKSGNWFELNPQRGRANNSAVFVRHKADRATFDRIWAQVRASGAGEPGIVWTNDPDWGVNPCNEAALRPFGLCNLTSMNASDIVDQADFERRCAAAAFIGTLQATYTDFHYLRDCWRRAAEKDALLGVSMTGVAAGRVLELDLRAGAQVVLDVNAAVAGTLGINPAARTTLLKPEGTTSNVVSQTQYCSSGVHAYHAEFMLRRMRVGKSDPVYRFLASYHPELVADDFFNPSEKAVIEIPVKAPAGAITRTEPAVALLERVLKLSQEWIRPGHRHGANHHNVSCTVTVKADEWDTVGAWMWEHRDSYSGLSVLPYDDHTYVQAPFEEITEARYNELVESFRAVDLRQVLELEDATSLAEQVACAGGACEV